MLMRAARRTSSSPIVHASAAWTSAAVRAMLWSKRDSASVREIPTWLRLRPKPMVRCPVVSVYGFNRSPSSRISIDFRSLGVVMGERLHKPRPERIDFRFHARQARDHLRVDDEQRDDDPGELEDGAERNAGVVDHSVRSVHPRVAIYAVPPAFARKRTCAEVSVRIERRWTLSLEIPPKVESGASVALGASSVWSGEDTYSNSFAPGSYRTAPCQRTLIPVGTE